MLVLELAFLEDQQPQSVLEVRGLEGGGAERLEVFSLGLSLASIEVRQSLLLHTLRLQQLGLLVLALLKRENLNFAGHNFKVSRV